MKKKNTCVPSVSYQQIRKNIVKNFCALAIAVFASLIATPAASAQTTADNFEYVYYKIEVNAPPVVIPEEVTINGLVKDEAGMPLANATIKADYGKELLTDNNGAFSFVLKKEQVIPQSIFASYDKLVTAVRSYHPSMESTTYNITLFKPTVCCNKIKKCEGAEIKPFSISVNNSTLTTTIKKQLDTMSDALKECPTKNIHLTLRTLRSKSLQELAKNKLLEIKNYLIEQDGITANRISIEEIIDAENNSIDITTD